VVLDSYGSPTSCFTDNTITRDGIDGVKAAVEVRGTFQVVANQISGFDEPGAVAFSLFPDAIGRACPSVIRGNHITGCAALMSESVEGLWKACETEGDVMQ